ncbi:hypothetical protein [Microvirga aerophila]|uniref:hypothetical protein n=1 Tax=Microvirga aerophila TaxID=670291 RepID=UPI000DEFF871|nr:hypothetical protein [Microvirga aerophila]
MTKSDLQQSILDILKDLRGRAHLIDVAREIWSRHEADLRLNDLFYTWQYDMRWAAQRLVDEGKLTKIGHTGIWELR